MSTSTESKNLYILGDIDDKNSSNIIQDILEDSWINVNTLNLYICSSGGDLHLTLAMIDLLEYYKERNNFTINTYGFGKIASGAVFLFLLGDQRLIYPKCRIYVHEHICVDSDQLPFTEQHISHKEDIKLNELYITWIAQRLKISARKSKSLLRLTKWLTDREIDKYNIVTGRL